MGTILKEKITGPVAWKGADFKDDTSWLYQLSDADVATIDSALAHAKKNNVKFPNVTKADFPLDNLSGKFLEFSEELENGRGFLLLRGLPVARYSEDDINLIYFGIGLHLGTPVGQNPKGEVLGTVMNVADANDKNSRVYQTNAYLPYHSDPSDVVGLLCLRQAKTGGLSSLVSAAAIYNEILENHPELLGVFYRPMYYAHLGEGLPIQSQLFSYHEGKLSCRYLRQYIELGHEQREYPLSAVEVEALDLFDSIMHSAEFCIDMMMEPGDLQFANNYAVLHSRTDFEDHAEPERRRKMLRLWLKMPNARVLGPEFPGRNGFELTS